MVEVIQPSAVDLIYDVSGNHVIQKMVKRLDESHLYFLKAAISQPIGAMIAPPFIPKSDDNIEPDPDQLKSMAKDKQACRVIQRLIEYCGQDYTRILHETICDHCLEELVTDQYGNYVL